MIFPKKEILYAPMLATLGGGSLRSFGRGTGGGAIEVGTLTEHYNANTEAGLRRVMFNNQEYNLNYAVYNSKGWVEVLFHGDVAEGHHQRSGQFYDTFGGGYKLLSENTVGYGMDYTADYAQIMLGTNITPTDIAITSKNNRTVANIAATGQNQNNALPLIASTDMAGDSHPSTGVSAARTNLLNFFRGTDEGMSAFYNAPSTSATNHSYDAYWSKQSLNLAITLFNRDGATQTDHWQIASGQHQSGSTYYANVGYRGAPGGSWISRFVGSWASNASTSPVSTYQITNSNVLSIWLTDM